MNRGVRGKKQVVTTLGRHLGFKCFSATGKKKGIPSSLFAIQSKRSVEYVWKKERSEMIRADLRGFRERE